MCPLITSVNFTFRKVENENQSHILGFIPHDEMPNVYRDSDAMILPSAGEGLPLTLLEGGASGLPLIATEIATGGTNIIEDEVNGYIIDATKINDIAHKISLSLENKEKMGYKNRKIVENYFTWDIFLKKVVSEYRSLLEK